MRVGASTFIWESPLGDDKLHLARHVADLGFDTPEICIEDPARVTASAVQEAAADAGVSIAVCGAFGPDRDVSHEDPARRRLGIDYLKSCIDLAAAVSASNVIGPMYSATGKTRLLSSREREQQRAWATESLREAGEYAADRGVGLAIEPLNRFETDLINTVEQGLDLCERIGLDNVGLLLDTFHMNIEEKSIPDAIRQAGSRMRHFHACENDRGAPGSGRNIDWDGVARGLKEINYDGDAVIESFTPKTKSIAAAAAIWRQLAPTQDALASDGLAFLRKTLA